MQEEKESDIGSHTLHLMSAVIYHLKTLDQAIANESKKF